MERVIGGPRTCSGLSELGIAQVGRLHDRLRSTGELTVDALYSSQYPRARATAAAIAPALGGKDVLIDAGFGEHDPGPDCDGMSYDDFTARYGSGHDWSNPFAETFPGGETVAEFHLRVGSAAHALFRRHPGQSVLIACHGGVIDCLMRQLMRLPPTGGFELHTLNTSLTELVQTPSGAWRLIRYNDAAHLAGL